ncbi:capsule biosynthesis protein [Paracoccus pacificus]|uniref:Capsule biosynthesis protein n=1 Tax=Paracoccus pacificus TaxID=1463598 RepID=A0ABW4R5C5_9RHOB
MFLLLQGPHGPFFHRLARLLTAAGATCWRVAFNGGDAFFWSDQDHLIRHDAPPEAWPAHLDQIIARNGVTDIVLYGDVRPIHAAARAAAAAHGITLHVFEEGYLRPFWITYERGGSNGHSALMRIPLERMRAALDGSGPEITRPPATWGDMRQHKFYGALYHFLLLTRRRQWPRYRTHRDVGVWREYVLHMRRIVRTPLNAALQLIESSKIRRGGFPFVLVPLQLEHDSNFVAHSDFERMADFVNLCLDAFAAHAPRHHHIVFKAHPLEDGRGDVRGAIRDRAAQLGLQDRVHFVPGGKLAALLAQARSVLTVNSTSAQQALWRGLPVKALGRAVYDKPGLVSEQPLDRFLENPARPDARLYRVFRDYLLDSSQVPGGYYAARSRGHALRLVVDMMLAPDDPYQALEQGRGTSRQQIWGGD